MKTGIVYALTLVVLINGEDGIYGNSNHETNLHDVNPYKHLLRVRSVVSQQVCVPRSTKIGECDNSCFCLDDGSGWACTEKGCEVHVLNFPHPDSTATQSDVANPSQRAKRELDAPYSCVPNSRFKIDCNWCTCTPDGRSAMCTLIGCLHNDFLQPSPNTKSVE